MAVGCSGGNKGGGTPATAVPSAVPSASASATDIPTTRPTGSASASASASAAASATPFVLDTATPVPAATAPPTGAVNTVTSRPLAAGDTFRYTGTTSQTFVYMGVTPNPSSTSVAAVTQTVTVSTGKTYAGVAGLDEFTTNETDTTSNATTSTATNAYYALTTGPSGQQALTTYGSTSTASSGETLATVLTNPGYNGGSGGNGTVDLLPEARTPTWTNTQAQTLAQTESDGFSAMRTYAANGTYVEHATYPQSSAASPQPTPFTATITENADGSGVYNLPLFQPPNVNIDFAAPTSAGLIAITIADASGQVLDSEMASAWFAQPLSLYSELDRNNGAVTYPAACNVPSSYGTTGNQLEQKYTRTDTIVGTLEFFDQLTYVSSNGTAACVQLSDVTYVYYDYSGQSNPNAGVAFGGGNAPYETQTIATTLGIASETLNAVARRPDVAAARAASASAVANARADFVHTVERYRTQRERAMAAHFRARLARLHR